MHQQVPRPPQGTRDAEGARDPRLLALLDIRYASIERLARELRAGRFSCAELADAALALLGEVGPRFNAIATLMPERAQREAARADRQLARGDAPLLAGIPYGAKDLLAARGAPTTWGSPTFRDQRFAKDATVISRLSRRGAVLAAKLALSELAGGGGARVPGASLHGSARNPWDPERYSGGSSSGPGVAVATGLVPFALGSETAGSILSPSVYCGVTGIRPTYGLVPRTGAMSLAWTLDKIGVLARSARDCALALEAIAGPDGADASAAGRFRALAPEAAREAVASVRVGYSGDDLEGGVDDVKPALERGLAELRRVLPPFRPARVREGLPYASILQTVTHAEASATFAELLDADMEMTDAKQKAELRASLEIRARDYLQAMRLRTVIAAEMRALFREVDVLVSPSRLDVPPRLDQPNPRRGADTTPDRLRVVGNLAGLPGVFFPCGIGDNGIPVGLQVVGPPRSESLLLAIVEAYQRETDHHLATPTHA